MREAAVVLLVGSILASPAAARVDGPVAVSPGSSSGSVVADPCPTFDWGGIEGARTYELVVYRIEDGQEPVPVLTERIPGAALGWTPALGRCLEPGGRYAWMVRAVARGEVSLWSEPLLFQVAAAPSEADFERALLLVERYLATRGATAEELASRAGAPPDQATELESSESSSVPAAHGGADFSVDSSGNVAGLSFSGDGSALANVTAVDLVGAAAVSISELDFDPATQTELETMVGGHVHAGEAIVSGTVGEACIDPSIARDAEIFPAVLAGGGPGSGLDADTLDGMEAAELQSYVPDNLVRNSSFEQWEAGSPHAWALAGLGSANTATEETTDPYHSAVSMRLLDSNTEHLYATQTLIESVAVSLHGAELAVSLWVRQVDTTRPAGFVGLQVSAGDDPPAVRALLPSGPGAESWQRVTLTHTLGSADQTLVLWLSPAEDPADTGAYDFDAIMASIGGDPAVGYRASLLDQLHAAGELRLSGDLGIGTLSPTERLEVAGNVKAAAFIGDGSGLTGVAAAEISGVLGVAQGGTGTTTPEDARAALGAAAQSQLAAHVASPTAHHVPTVDTTCNGAACDGSLFTHLQWGSLEGVPDGFSDAVDHACSVTENDDGTATLACDDGSAVTWYLIKALEVSAGYNHTCGLLMSGSVVCWGWDDEGESSPPSGFFTQVSAGGAHTCGVRSTGSLACWGLNQAGQSSPPAGSFTQVSAGGNHTCAVGSDGSVACWGSNWWGQSSAPAGSFTQVSAGLDHSCGLRSDGSIACWGKGLEGQSSPPTGIFTQVAAGGFHTCAVGSTGSLACWGSDALGQSSPPSGSFTQVSAGYINTCGLRSDGSLACWGGEGFSAMGPPPGVFTHFSTSYDHSCAVRPDGSIACWGSDLSGACAVPPALQ